MNEFETALTRFYARSAGRAVTVRAASSISNDPAETIGIVTMKIVTEEQIQALAFGDLNGAPHVVVRLNPIGRDVADLEPFADFLSSWADRVLDAAGEGRLWVPHDDTVEALDILGHRYWRNENAPTPVRRMGEICRILAHEARFPGQQMIANAQALLSDHVVTGLCPAEEAHLDALLAWLDPTVADPLGESRDRIRLPASGILPNTPDHPADDQVERLRKFAKESTGAERASHEADIAEILTDAVLREWRMLVAARRAFQALSLPSGGLGKAMKRTKDRVAYALLNGHFPARRPDRIAVELEEMQAGNETAERAAIESDSLFRDQAARQGRVLRGTVSEVSRQRQGGKTLCSIQVTTDQSVVRLRPDDKVDIVGTNVRGVVRTIGRDESGQTVLDIEITNGVRSTQVLTRGVPVDVAKQAYANVRTRTYSEVKSREPWLFFGDTRPALATTAPASSTPLELAERRRRS